MKETAPIPSPASPGLSSEGAASQAAGVVWKGAAGRNREVHPPSALHPHASSPKTSITAATWSHLPASLWPGAGVSYHGGESRIHHGDQTSGRAVDFVRDTPSPCRCCSAANTSFSQGQSPSLCITRRTAQVLFGKGTPQVRELHSTTGSVSSPASTLHLVKEQSSDVEMPACVTSSHAQHVDPKGLKLHLQP